MLTMGIYNGHNAAICIMQDSKIILNWELERWSRIKHDYGFNGKFLQASLDRLNISWDDIDVILTNRQDGGRAAPWHAIIPSTNVDWHISFLIDGKKAYAVNHHLAHVASAYYTSPFDIATIVTQDGGGDDENFSAAHATDHRIRNYFPGRVMNLAGFWSGITLNNYRMPRLHKWDPGSGAGKIMALAAYGETSDELEQQIIDGMNEGMKPHYTDVHSRAFNNDEDLSDTTKQRSQDVAAALQSLTEKRLKDIYNEVFQNLPSENLCLAGGIALNCVANTRVKSNFKNIHVPPFPNDTGLAVGMCLYHWHHILGNPKSNKLFSPYLGPEYSNQEVTDALENTDFKYKQLDIDEIVNQLCQRKPITIARGRSESGPRALGHRSIVAIPDMENGRDHLNFKIKKREWYRPYAPIIIDKYVDDILEDYNPVSPYMTTSAYIKEEWRARLSAVNHVDNSTRPQIITEEQDPFVYELITKVYNATGIPVLLNTSFNKQEPIVETPEQALNTFRQFDIDFMVLHNYMVYK